MNEGRYETVNIKTEVQQEKERTADFYTAVS